MQKAWKRTWYYNGEAADVEYQYSEPTEQQLAQDCYKFEEIQIKGPVYKIYYTITDGGDGSHSVEFFPSQAAIDEQYDDEGFPKDEDEYSDVPVEMSTEIIDLSDYEVITC